jgi:two-component sensor histidine kinase
VAALISVLIIVYLLVQVNKKNKLLLAKNAEKDVLIQEIHHRVKNNLQFISSLINMQINTNEKTGDASSLNDASRRIKAMSLVHEMLYNQKDLAGVNIKNYLTELLATINDLVNSEKIPIEFEVNIEEMMFDTSNATALGMITSELVSNAIKYAFKNYQTKPIISVSLKLIKETKQIEFRLSDNGSGFEQTNEARKKLGMRLIGIFSKQLKGEYKFENKDGLIFILLFKEN